ncbi:stearoyl-CoA 9-desaturase [Amycolatopsis antarctica]|uniref:Stearoyl-CoA 9-desaturase n=1 Tax=Amycolatopsis antarctica TaxID=1854586 RepID=A0A263D379_9PSEU|nr:ferredoxin reductase [Amycolatopsis antarctica]OZM72077.1 stearoyl-CoA 9-desaturase [Amycolatopsis antarctica]
MAETGMRPSVPPLRRRALRAVRLLFTPLLPDDYLELVNPLWSTRELRGRVERVEPERGGAATVLIRPGFDWAGHEPGQYLRLGVVVDGVNHWRAYSLTSSPDRADGLISITPKVVDGGTVSSYLVHRLRTGDIVRLGVVEGGFTLPERRDRGLLFVTAGSGITPVMSMLRHLDMGEGLRDIVHVHSARSTGEVTFAEELDTLERRYDGFRLHRRATAVDGRLTPADLEAICPDWRERETFCCGPGELLDALRAHWTERGDPGLLHMERFQPVVGGADSTGTGGTVRFVRRDVEAECPPGTPILVAGENAGIEMPYGCRVGICHTCVLRVREGRIRDLRTGDVSETRNEIVRTCVHGAEGDVALEL